MNLKNFAKDYTKNWNSPKDRVLINDFIDAWEQKKNEELECSFHGRLWKQWADDGLLSDDSGCS